MKSNLLTLFIILIMFMNASAQWAQRANFPGVTRSRSTAFTIGNKIYVMGGYAVTGAVLNDFWEYDITANTWLHKQNFPGAERYGAASFVVNNKVYVATGANDFGYLDDAWSYDPVTDNWTQKTGLPVGSAQHENQRREAFAFAIGNKGYLGGGDGFIFGSNQTWNYAFSDLWEYNPLSNAWTHVSDIPDFLGRNMSIAVAVNNKAYVGLGCNVDQTTGWQSFWEYDPVANTWTAKTDFPTVYTTDAGAIVLDSDIYVVGGVKFNPVDLTAQVHKYNIPSDTWTALTNFNGGAVAGEFAVSTGSTAFTGTGFNSAFNTRNDLWEYTSVNTSIDSKPVAVGNVLIYPNPISSNTITVSVNSLNAVQYHFTIADITGRIILQQEIMMNAGKAKIEIGDLSKGMYVLTLTNEEGSVSIKVMKD
jgi:N-acetylneuraminic acid mutarotase